MVTVRDAQGNVAFQGPVPFLPQDTNLTSTGVIKVPDALGKDGKPDQLAFSGYFTPTGDTSPGDRCRRFPALTAPLLWLTAYHGDLGIDAGIAQNVYQLDTSHMKQFRLNTTTGVNGVVLKQGEDITLPDGQGSLTYDGVKTWASFTISHQAGNESALISGALAILGLAMSLFIQRRRIWVRALPGPDGTTLVELGGLGRSESARIADEIGDVAMQLVPDAPPRPEDPQPADGQRSADEPQPADGQQTTEDPQPADDPQGTDDPRLADRAARPTEDTERTEHAGDPDDPATPPAPTSPADDEGARA